MNSFFCMTAAGLLAASAAYDSHVQNLPAPDEGAILVAQAKTNPSEKKSEKKTEKKTTERKSPVGDSIEGVAAKVQKAYEGVSDLSAKFSQQISVQGGSRMGPESTGMLYLKKPGKLRWEFDGAMMFISDGSTMWQYDPEENQVIVNKFMQETTSITALNFLAGMGKLREAFDVTKAEPKGDNPDRGIFIKLTPKDEEDVQLTALTLVINKKDWLAHEAYLTDALGNETHLVFTNIKTNGKLADSKFAFEIPEGAEVIEPSLLAPQ